MKILAAIILLAAVVLCEKAETKSRKWYADRLLLRASGFFAGAALVSLFL